MQVIEAASAEAATTVIKEREGLPMIGPPGRPLTGELKTSSPEGVNLIELN